jgi:hypothetical protein
MKPPQQQQQSPAMYDFVLALSRLQDKIQSLSALKQQSSAPATRLGASWSFLRATKGNVLLLLTFYSMSTASIMGCGMAERRLQVGVCLCVCWCRSKGHAAHEGLCGGLAAVHMMMGLGLGQRAWSCLEWNASALDKQASCCVCDKALVCVFKGAVGHAIVDQEGCVCLVLFLMHAERQVAGGQ